MAQGGAKTGVGGCKSPRTPQNGSEATDPASFRHQTTTSHPRPLGPDSDQKSAKPARLRIQSGVGTLGVMPVQLKRQRDTDR